MEVEGLDVSLLVEDDFLGFVTGLEHDLVVLKSTEGHGPLLGVVIGDTVLISSSHLVLRLEPFLGSRR